MLSPGRLGTSCADRTGRNGSRGSPDNGRRTPNRRRVGRQRVGRILIVSASVGAGHDGAATALARRLSGAGHTCVVKDLLDLLPGGLGQGIRASYAMQLRACPDNWGRLYQRLEHRGRLQAAGRAVGRLAAPRVSESAAGADVVVCTYPLAAHAAGALRRAGRLDVPVITYLTDMAVHPLW